MQKHMKKLIKVTQIQSLDHLLRYYIMCPDRCLPVNERLDEKHVEQNAMSE